LSYKVGTKGQIVIDQEIREALGVEPGWTASQRLVAEHVEVRFFPPEHDRSLAGVLAPYVNKPLSQDDWGKTKERVWAEAVAEGEGSLEPPPAPARNVVRKGARKAAKKPAKKQPGKKSG